MWIAGSRLCRWALALGLLALGWWLFAPTTLGGYDTYAMVSGPSMWPRLVTGDLVVLRPASHYRVGEIAGYRTPQLRDPIVHQIVAVRDGHYTFKGANNAFEDPSHPVRSEILGRQWLVLGRTSPLLRLVKEPAVGAVLVFGSVLVALVPARRARRLQRRRRVDAL